MDAIATGRKLRRGSPYLVKELRAIVSDHTSYFIGLPRTVHIWRGAPCNAKCVMCPWGFLEGEALRPFVRSAFKDDDMPRALVQIAELCGRGTIVSYMGGSRCSARGSSIGSSRLRRSSSISASRRTAI